jgi:hypothetical protein
MQEIRAQPTLRLDPDYWIKKKAQASRRQASSTKQQATSLTIDDYRIIKDIRPGGRQLKLDEARRFVHKRISQNSTPGITKGKK